MTPDFPEVSRPEGNKRSIHKVEEMQWDQALEAALLKTLATGGAIAVPLSLFHKSPAKGRLWKKGFRVRHRVRGEVVHAWVAKPSTPKEQ